MVIFSGAVSTGIDTVDAPFYEIPEVEFAVYDKKVHFIGFLLFYCLLFIVVLFQLQK